jgi:hypothetical protein
LKNRSNFLHASRRIGERHSHLPIAYQQKDADPGSQGQWESALSGDHVSASVERKGTDVGVCIHFPKL